MKYDADATIHAGSTLNADICVIGSGAAAISLAHSLLPTGRKIIMLEGSRVNLPRVPLSHAHISKSATTQNKAYFYPHRRYSDPEAQRLCAGTLLGDLSSIDPRFLTRSRTRCYGGTTNCWGGWTVPLSECDFDRSDLNSLCKWPIRREHLVKFYNSAIFYCSLGKWKVSAYDDPSFWIRNASRELALIPLKEDSGLQTLIMAIINDKSTDGRRLSFQLAWGPSIEAARNISIYRNAHARFLLTTPGNGSVTRVIASTIHDGGAGHDFSVSAGHFIIAAGGIETPRLLLVSNEIGNRNDQLGRYFMIHPLNERAACVTAGPTRNNAISNFYCGVSETRLTFAPKVIAILTPRPEAMKKWGIGNFRARLDSPKYIDFNWEQLPNPESRIVLSPDTDPFFSDPTVTLKWKPSQLDMKTLRIGIGSVLEELSDVGILTVNKTNLIIERAGDHHMGATRMAAAPRDGVVDSNCRVHGVDNLYIASSSVFPTSGFANPTLTVIALALRLGKHLTDQL